MTNRVFFGGQENEFHFRSFRRLKSVEKVLVGYLRRRVQMATIQIKRKQRNDK
jgi:hypothetical protein